MIGPFFVYNVLQKYFKQMILGVNWNKALWLEIFLTTEYSK